MSYEVFKALHLIFIVTWFAGLFYIVRLFIYHVEAHENRDLGHNEKKVLTDQFQLMQKRLWYGITWPSCLLTFIFGLGLLHNFFPITDHPWLIVKLAMVLLLFVYHLSCGRIHRQLSTHNYRWSSTKLRIWNEVATIFLVAIVFLAVSKNTLSLVHALIGLVVLSAILMLAITLYRKVRQRS